MMQKGDIIKAKNDTDGIGKLKIIDVCSEDYVVAPVYTKGGVFFMDKKYVEEDYEVVRREGR